MIVSCNMFQLHRKIQVNQSINHAVLFIFISAGIGCKVAGFLTVFATHLSVFTLTLITIERWYAITHAIYLNKRIKIKAASCIMVCGWIYSMVMSSLPLFGFSNYSSTRYERIVCPCENIDRVCFCCFDAWARWRQMESRWCVIGCVRQ